MKRSSARPEDELPTLAHIAMAYLMMAAAWSVLFIAWPYSVGHRWRSAQARRAAKREMRVGASGRWANQAVRRSRLRAAAVATFCRPVLASPR